METFKHPLFNLNVLPTVFNFGTILKKYIKTESTIITYSWSHYPEISHKISGHLFEAIDYYLKLSEDFTSNQLKDIIILVPEIEEHRIKQCIKAIKYKYKEKYHHKLSTVIIFGRPSIVNCNDNSFLAPKSMTDAVRYYCERTGQKIPQSMGEVMVVIYNSLAQSYKDTVAELEEMSGRKFTRIHVVGGGCQDMFLNQKIKTFTGKEVYAGPVEGTALGNLMVQMLKDGSFKTLEEARECVASSFDVKKVD